MALALADRVQETSTTSGTGTISLLGAATGYKSFANGVGNANSTYYCIYDTVANTWEVGIGTYTTAGSTLSRTTVLSNSSNTTSLISFAGNLMNVFVTYPSSITSGVAPVGSITTNSDAVINTIAAGIGAGANPTNTVFGAAALSNNTSGYSSVAIGNQALKNNTLGYYNTATGQGALYYNLIGFGCSAFGYNALYNNVTDYNTALGYTAGSVTTSGTNSTFIGANAQPSTNSDTNTIVIGYNAAGLGSNTTVIGNSSTTSTKLFGSLSLTSALSVANGGTNGTSTPTAGAVPYGTGTAYAFTAAGTSGQVLTSSGAGAPTWTTVSGSGTVTSVAATVPSFLSISGSPITTTGTLAIGLSGTALPVANGGTGATTASLTSFNNITGYAVSGPSGSTTSSLVFSNGPSLLNPTIQNYDEAVVTANTTATYTISLSAGTFQILTLTANATITMPTVSAGKSFFLILKQDATGGRSVTWTTVSWPSATAPTITTTASKKDLFSFFSDGTSWYGSTISQNYT